MDKIKSWIFGSPELLPNEKLEQARQTDYVKPETQIEEKTVHPQALVPTIKACKEDELVASSILVSPQEEEFDFSAFQRTVPGKLLLTCLMTGGLYSVSRHGSYLCKKKNIMRLHHKALSVVLLGYWSHYMLLEWYLPYIVKYGPGGNELPKSYGDALKYLRENYIVQCNQNEVTDQ